MLRRIGLETGHRRLHDGHDEPTAAERTDHRLPRVLEYRAGEEIVVDKGNSLVNNSFAAPTAEGCGGLFSFLVDPAVNAEIGLPSAAGHNTAILNGTQELAASAAVRASE